MQNSHVQKGGEINKQMVSYLYIFLGTKEEPPQQ
jgi:hypothetical protein